ncbi:MAG TPA: DoxX family protein [Bacteroidales bacterium]
MKTNKIMYWVTTGLVSLFMLFSSYMYLSKSPQMMDAFQRLGYPRYFVMLLGTAKLMGVVALIQPKWEMFQEWAYAGFTFTFIGATWTHLSTGTPFIAPLIALVILGTSYGFRYKLAHK